MTITKNGPQSEFWKAAEAASRRVDKFPPWKLGILEPKAPPAKDELSPVVAEQAEGLYPGNQSRKVARPNGRADREGRRVARENTEARR